MRILHVVPTYLPATRYGGPIYSVHALCKSLAAAGHDVRVFTTNVDGAGVSDVPLNRPVEHDGVMVRYFSTAAGRRVYRSPALGEALRQQVSTFEIAHLHSVFLWPTAAAADAARRSRVPYVLSPRGMLVGDLIRRKSWLAKTAWMMMFENRNISGASAMHFTSSVEADEFRRLGFKARREAIIANGIDLPPAAATARASVSPQPTVLCLGRISWKKGLDRLIAAMTFVPGACLMIAGNDEEGYRSVLMAKVQECGLADRVHFRGPVQGQAKWDLLASADIFALASYSENFGNVVLEAMASGVPVVVTPQVGLAPAILASEAGLVAHADPESIGTAIASLLADPGERRRLGANGRKVASEQFGWSAIARSMLDLYGELAGSEHMGRDPSPTAEIKQVAAT